MLCLKVSCEFQTCLIALYLGSEGFRDGLLYLYAMKWNELVWRRKTVQCLAFLSTHTDNPAVLARNAPRLCGALGISEEKPWPAATALASRTPTNLSLSIPPSHLLRFPTGTRNVLEVAPRLELVCDNHGLRGNGLRYERNSTSIALMMEVGSGSLVVRGQGLYY